MSLAMYVMKFQVSHFGEGYLDSATIGFQASRLYSALVLEAIKHDKLKVFEALSQASTFVISDGFPFQFSPFLPKPIGYPKRQQEYVKATQIRDVRRAIKRQKKLKYIDYAMMEDFLSGEIFDDYDYAVSNVMTKVDPEVEGALFQVGITHYQDTSLYVIAEQSELMDQLMTSLQYTGLGGKRSSGYGQFELEILPIPEEMMDKLTIEANEPVLLLTSALPKDSELAEVMNSGKYLLHKNSGFAFSTSNTENFRKQDLYKFLSGSTFDRTFEGQIVDVRPNDFPHPVWNFAKPLFYKLGVTPNDVS